MSCMIAAHLSHRLSEFLQTFSNTSSVWRIVLWLIPFLFSTPLSASISGKTALIIILESNLKPILGLSAMMILLSSVCTLQ